ncbi:DNase I-like protein [Trametes versicolor FP-101664 SS1]|uniref:DNase I-like protein n=1 Tax=Trametes versicolor (strain FP-101664) TaxID=717944 RepID=UPI00046238D0|nr:DNase I-like protein [Trametes versicolor FP-101664 SS1]EIW62456.1 DNase I-like protein [Trametes versicolor FP-101664 SS1]
MRDQRIAVLALQEAHLNEERVSSLRQIFGRHLHIEYSPDPSNSTGARGVTAVLNKQILKNCTPTTRCVIPGRAILLSVPWSEDRVLTILTVYAPNDRNENAAFWERLRAENLGRIDLLLGDFNVVEEAADRFPPKSDAARQCEALRELCQGLSVCDGWRAANPASKQFTYLHETSGAQSRLDRIYVRRAMMGDCDEWTITEPGIPTDHLLVTVEVANYKAPFVGRGRWVMPTHLLTDTDTVKQMKGLAMKLVADIAAIRTRTCERNPQLLYEKFKADLTALLRARAKVRVPKIQKEIDALKAELKAAGKLPSRALRRCSTQQNCRRN